MVSQCPTNSEMTRSLVAAGYRRRRFKGEHFVRWTVGTGVKLGRIRCTSWLSTEMAYRELQRQEGQAGA